MGGGELMIVARKSHDKYANKCDYRFYKDGCSVGHIVIDFKLPNEELKEELKDFKAMCGADSVFLHWTARDGFINKEVVL